MYSLSKRNYFSNGLLFENAHRSSRPDPELHPGRKQAAKQWWYVEKRAKSRRVIGVSGSVLPSLAALRLCRAVTHHTHTFCGLRGYQRAECAISLSASPALISGDILQQLMALSESTAESAVRQTLSRPPRF